MGKVNRQAFLIDIFRYGGEFLITVTLSLFMMGLFIGLWREFNYGFRGQLLLLIPIIYITTRAVVSLYKFYQQVADLYQGPLTLLGYVTLHDAQTRWRYERGQSWVTRIPIGERLVMNVVPAATFARWLGKPEWQIKPEAVEGEYRFDPDPDALATRSSNPEFSPGSDVWQRANNTIHPLTFEAPRWAFDMVRLGDLVKIKYAMRTRRIYNVEVMLSVMMPD